jgi:hypothetical protein
MSRLSRVIAPMLHAAGLDVRPVGRADGELHELVVTSPAHPDWGRFVIDRDGLVEWTYRGDLVTDAGAAAVADVVSAVMAPRPGHLAGHALRATRAQRSAEGARPYP